jgi:hypothetical protein
VSGASESQILRIRRTISDLHIYSCQEQLKAITHRLFLSLIATTANGRVARIICSENSQNFFRTLDVPQPMQKIIGLIAALVAGGSWLYVAPALADEPPGPALSLKFDKTGLHPGDTVTAFGTLQKPGSPPLAGQNVKVSVCWGELYGECRQTVTVTTDANGNYSAPFSLGDPVTGYPPRARAYFAGLGTAPNY